MMPSSANPKMFKVRRPDTGQIGDVAEHNLDMAISLGGEVIDNLPEQSIGAPSSTNPQRMFKVRRPDTGEIGEVSEANLQKAKELGGEIIENTSESPSVSSNSLGKYGARKAKDLIAGAVGGLADTATAAYNIPASLTNAANDFNKDNPVEIDPISGMPMQKSEGERPQLPLIPSATEAIDQSIDNLTNDYTKTPENEKTSQAALRTIGSVASPGGLAKGAAALGMKGASKALGAIGSTNPSSLAAAGAAGAATHKASEEGYGTAASIGAGLGAGAAAGGSLAVAKSFNAKLALAKLTGNSPKNINLEAVQAAENAGLDYPNTLANESRGLGVVEQVVSKSPYFGTKYNKKMSKIDKEYAQKVDEAIGRVGEKIVESGDSMDMGSIIKDTFVNVKENLKKEASAIYKEASDLLPKEASIKPLNLLASVKKIRKDINTLKPSADESFLLKYIDDIESRIVKSEKIPEQKLGLSHDLKLEWIPNDAKPSKTLEPVSVKTLVGSKVSINDVIDWDVNASGVRNKLKSIQNAIRSDIQEYGKQNEQWLSKFSEADNFYGKYLGDRGITSDTLKKKIFAQENPEKILGTLNDISDFRNLRQSLGADQSGQKFFDSIKREKLTDLIMGKVIDNKTGNVTYLPFAKVIESPQSKQLIKYLAGENYSDILNLKKYAAAALKRNQRNPNPSGTGSTNAIIGGFVGAAAEGGGLIKKAKSFATLTVAGAALSWLVNNKKALAWGVEAAKKQTAGNYKDANIFAKRLEKIMVEDLGEDFVKQFVALSGQETAE